MLLNTEEPVIGGKHVIFINIKKLQCMVLFSLEKTSFIIPNLSFLSLTLPNPIDLLLELGRTWPSFNTSYR